MSLLEDAIAALSPRWAAHRAYYRTVLQASRAYDAAKIGRRTDGWVATGASANTEIGPALPRIRARCRDLRRNNPWAAKALRVLPAKVVGTGITPRPITDDDNRRRQAADTWQAFVENSDPAGITDFYGQMKQAADCVFESGEAIVRFLPRPSSWNLPVPLQLQVLEPDYLDSTQSQTLANGNVVIQGVEYDPDGRRVAFWLFDEHPGEVWRALHKSTFQSRRVPASEVLHVFDPIRPGQARGVPVLAPVVLKLRDVDDFDDAELMRKKIAACFAAFVKRQGSPTTPLAKSTTTDADGRRIEGFGPGMVQYLQPGEEVNFADPPSAEGYVDYMRMQLHAVAAGAGVTYWQLTGDLSQFNFSSMRGGLVDFWDLVDCWQWHMMVPQLCQPVWNRVDRLMYALGKRWGLGARAAWTPPVRRYIDPMKEVQAQKEAIKGGLLLHRAAIAEQGENPDAFLEEAEAWNRAMDQRGIAFDTDGRRAAGPAKPAVAADEDGQPAKGANDEA